MFQQWRIQSAPNVNLHKSQLCDIFQGRIQNTPNLNLLSSFCLIFFSSGHGVKKDEKMAFYWFRLVLVKL